MPDQSSASTEHALMQEITAPLATLPDDPVPVVADPGFPVVLRGYDRESVDAYVRKTSQLVAELQATRSPEAAVRRALERVGAEVSGILQRAHDTASTITAQSRSEAEDRLEAARHEAAQIVTRAEERVRELDAETDRIWDERHRIVEDTRELARELLSLTDSAADRFPPDAGLAADAALPGLEAAGSAGIEAAGPAGIEAVPPAAMLPDVEDDARAESAPIEVPIEDALPDEVAAGGQDPDVEPTAILPVVEPPEDDTDSEPK
jgi:vacuolar-type H+-ATPase subunit H